MFIRQRNNPFYPFMEEHVVRWLVANVKAR
jgi:hypothetical protein